jgi:hypothetical protein
MGFLVQMRNGRRLPPILRLFTVGHFLREFIKVFDNDSSYSISSEQ